MESEFKECTLLIDGSQGIYVPQAFVTRYGPAQWGIAAEDVEILEAGPDHEHYWETWDSVLSDAEYSNEHGTWYLHQDGDLFAVVLNEESDHA